MLFTKHQRWFNFLNLVILVSLTLLINYLTQFRTSKTLVNLKVPRLQLTNSHANLYNESGNLIYTLNAEQLTELPTESFISLNNYKLQTNSDNPADFTVIFGDEGRVNSKGNILNATKNLKAEYHESNQDTIYVATNSATVDLNKHTVSGNEKITATQRKNKITGTGFFYDIDQQHLTLNSQVDILYYNN